MEKLKATLSRYSQVLTPQDPGYDEARTVWNGMVDKKPAYIVKATGVADVVAAVKFAKQEKLKVSCLCGGHSTSGTCLVNDGLVIDMRGLQGAIINPESKTAIVRGGNLLYDVDREAAAYGLATTGGIISHTGFSGLAVGGGVGHLMRQYGLTVDNILGMEVVTADGEILNVNKDSHPDLFWAMRGAGSHYGVVTSFTMQLYPLSMVSAGVLVFPFSSARSILTWVEANAESLDRRIGVLFMAVRSPEGHDTLLAVVTVASEDLDTAKDITASMLEAWGPRLAGDLALIPYHVWQHSLENPLVAHGRKFYTRGGLFESITPDFLDTFEDTVHAFPNNMCALELAILGGRVSDFPEDSAAFTGRKAKYYYHMVGNENPDAPLERTEAMIQWARGKGAALDRFRTASYANMHSPETEGDPVYAGKLERLRETKRKYDPENMFSSGAVALFKDLN